MDANSDGLVKTDEPIEFKMAGQADGALVPVNQGNHYPRVPKCGFVHCEWSFEDEAVAQPIFGGKSGGDYMKINFQSNIRLA